MFSARGFEERADRTGPSADARPRERSASVALVLVHATAALLGAAGAAAAPAVVAGPVLRTGLAAAGAWVAASSVLALVTHLRRHRLDGSSVQGSIELEREQEHGRELLARLELLGTEDALTGLANRRQWDVELTQACEEARRTGSSLGVVLLDLDHFKCLNDRRGHSAGDVVLQQVGALLLQSVRPGDRVARLGGDELAVLLPGVALDRAGQLAERLRAGIAQLCPPGFAAGEVTVSLGVAAGAGAEAFPVELMSRAEQQLFRAKITRNCVASPAQVPSIPTPRRPAEPAVAPH